MKQFLKIFTSVKKLVTLTLLVLFSVLVIRGEIDAREFMSVFMIVIGTYFTHSISKENKEKEQ